MSRDKRVERLMDKLLRAIEASLSATEAAREAVAEILRRGHGDLFRGDASPGVLDDAPPAGAAPPLTDLDREFLRSIAIRPENR